MKPEQVKELCRTIAGKFDVAAFPIHIVNARRWKFIGEIDENNLPLTPPHRLRLSETFGIIIYGWNNLSEDRQQEILLLTGTSQSF